MSIQDLIRELSGLFPTYYMFPIVDDHNLKPDHPFICVVPSQETTYADNTNFQKHKTYGIEYYFKYKQPEKEELLENKLNDLGFTFSRSDDTRVDDNFVIYYQI